MIWDGFPLAHAEPKSLHRQSQYMSHLGKGGPFPGSPKHFEIWYSNYMCISFYVRDDLFEGH